MFCIFSPYITWYLLNALVGLIFPPNQEETGIFNKKTSIILAVHVCSVVSDFATWWTVAQQAPLSTRFSRQEYWSGVPFPPPGDVPEPRIEPTSTASLALTGRLFTTEPLGKPNICRGIGDSASSSNSHVIVMMHILCQTLPCQF